MNQKATELSLNIQLYPWYVFFRDCYFWGPAFFLYFSSVLSLTQVLWLEAVYYVSVAILEVPSGYIADRLGRRPTLIFATGCMTSAYLLFFSGNTFWVFAIAQIFLASGFACASGTDTALHYESLKELGREEEYAGREARALKLSFIAGAVSALAGGAVALVYLKGIYLASAIAGLTSMALLFMIKEPSAQNSEVTTRTFTQQVPFLVRKACGSRLRFFTLFSAAMTLMVHIPYEFYQPYVERVALSFTLETGNAPLITGIHLAATMLLGSYCTRFVRPLNYHCKIRYALLACLGFQVLLVGLMALVVHPVIVLLLLGRTISKAIAVPLVNAEVAPILENNERSTYLSLQSLIGRVCYGCSLLLFPFSASLFEDSFQGTLFSATMLGILLLGVVWSLYFPQEGPSHCCGHSTHQSGSHP